MNQTNYTTSSLRDDINNAIDCYVERKVVEWRAAGQTEDDILAHLQQLQQGREQAIQIGLALAISKRD